MPGGFQFSLAHFDFLPSVPVSSQEHLKTVAFMSVLVFPSSTVWLPWTQKCRTHLLVDLCCTNCPTGVFFRGGGRSGGFWVARALAYKKAKLLMDFYDNKTDCSRKVQSIWTVLRKRLSLQFVLMLAKYFRTILKNFHISLRDHFPMAYNSVANFRDETINALKLKPKECLKCPFNRTSQSNV